MPAEVLEMTGAAARGIDQKIRFVVETINENLAKLKGLVKDAKAGQIHKALGFPSWTAYLRDVFTVGITLDFEKRRELEQYLYAEGVPQKVIADIVGVSQKTVSNDVSGRSDGTGNGPSPTASSEHSTEPISGVDGRKYTKNRRPAPRTPDLHAEAELINAVAGVLRRDRIKQYSPKAKEHFIRVLEKALKDLKEEA